MRISVPKSVKVGAVHAQLDIRDEDVLGPDEEWDDEEEVEVESAAAAGPGPPVVKTLIPKRRLTAGTVAMSRATSVGLY
ncbi:MAG: hypothetical protein JKX76_01935 [Colwellia sp.]|nr:hypothetical protein [Colwellia sp.]